MCEELLSAVTCVYEHVP